MMGPTIEAALSMIRVAGAAINNELIAKAEAWNGDDALPYAFSQAQEGLLNLRNHIERLESSLASLP